MTNIEISEINLGSAPAGVDFDSLFLIAKEVLHTFEATVVTFTFSDVVVRVEDFTSASEAFDQYEADRRSQS